MKEQDLLTFTAALLSSGVVVTLAKWALAHFKRPAPAGYKRVIRVEKQDGTVLLYEADEDEIVTRSDAKKIIKWLDTIHREHGEESVRSFSYSLVPKNEVVDVESVEDASGADAPSPSGEPS